MPSAGYSRRPSYVVGGGIQLSGAHIPESGPYGDGYKVASTGATWYDTSRGTQWINEGTATNPYWSPVSPYQPGLWGAVSDWRDEVGAALASTATEIILPGGVRVFGDGVDATDGGAVVQTAGLGGANLRLQASATAAKLTAIGSEAGVFQPSIHGVGILDVTLTHVAAITLRGMGIGFIGTAADGLVPPITAATATATLVQDDLALLHFNVGYTLPSRLYFAYNKANALATMPAVSTGVDIAAAGTLQRFRVEVGVDGDVRVFVNKVQVASAAVALTPTTAVSPVVYIESTSSAVKSMDVRNYLFVAGR